MNPSDPKSLPSCPSLEQYKNQAKDLRKAFAAARNAVDPETLRRIRQHHPRFADLPDQDHEIPRAGFSLADAQLVIAREHGFDSWPKFAKQVAALARQNTIAALPDPVSAFLQAASVPREGSHASGTTEEADAILAAHPAVAQTNVYTAAVLGDAAAVRRFLTLDPRSAVAKGGPYPWDALTYLCFSRYLRAHSLLGKSRSEDFVQAAAAILDAGANPNTGWMETAHEPQPVWESAIYGAAGLAHHPGLTRLLLERGADPNDDETPYHAPETYDNGAFQVLVESGKLSLDSLSMMLLRKTDWHDFEGVKFLLEHGVDPNRNTRWGKTALYNSVLSDNDLSIVQVLMDHGADPNIMAEHGLRGSMLPAPQSAIALAAWRGRGDLLGLFEQRGFSLALQGIVELIAACAMNKTAAIPSIIAAEPSLVGELWAEGGRLLTQFAGVGNTEGIRNLLDLGVPVGVMFEEGDGYFDVAKNSTALHAAAWRARHATVRLLLERGADVNALDGKGRTPLALAVRACVDSYWIEHRSPESVEALLRAGASIKNIPYPCGYEEVDSLLRSYGSTPI